MAHGYMSVSTEEPVPISLLTLLLQHGDYVVQGSQNCRVTSLDGIRAAVGESAKITYAQGCERWSDDQSGFPQAIKQLGRRTSR